nr:hypothetical protein [Tanacetum cinerariifolium]
MRVWDELRVDWVRKGAGVTWDVGISCLVLFHYEGGVQESCGSKGENGGKYGWKVNDLVKLQALINGKRVVIIEDVIRQALHLHDADGVEYLPNEEIFTELARMGYKKPPPKLTFYKAFFSTQRKFLIHTTVQCNSAKRMAWNEFSCSMASVVICFATGRKFNFLKYIFDSMVRNVDSPSKFLMYP